jgi:hypothetical protein
VNNRRGGVPAAASLLFDFSMSGAAVSAPIRGARITTRRMLAGVMVVVSAPVSPSRTESNPLDKAAWLPCSPARVDS